MGQVTDTQALRRVAEAAQQTVTPRYAWPDVRMPAARRFIEEMTPATILALLDDRDRLARRVEAANNQLAQALIKIRYQAPTLSHCKDIATGALAAFDTDRGEG